MNLKINFALLGLLTLTASFKEPPFVKLKKAFTSEFSFIPNGAAAVDGAESEVSAFYMQKTEVSNRQYREFLNAVEDKQSKERHSIKSEKWRETLKYGEPYAEHYHSHEAYGDYPVVNVTKESAQAYCDWLTLQYQNEDIGLPEDMGMAFRLPTRTEWVNAANGELDGPYAWGGPHVRNVQGQILANFMRYGPENIHRNPETGEYEVIPLPVYMGVPGNLNEAADVTAPVESYAPNGFGLHNMNGNVAEMVADLNKAVGGSWYSPDYDIRNESLLDFEEASPLVGFRPIGVLYKK